MPPLHHWQSLSLIPDKATTYDSPQGLQKHWHQRRQKFGLFLSFIEKSGLILMRFESPIVTVFCLLACLFVWLVGCLKASDWFYESGK